MTNQVTILRRGDTGPEVAEVRMRLAQLGLLPDEQVTGREFDAQVEEAVRAFQQDRGVVVDGIVGPVTLRRLDEARWQLGDRVLRFTPGQLMRGDDVIALQRRLNELGFDAGRADGIFGRQTDTALREFQRGVGCSVDGVCGPQTFAAFERLSRTVSGGDAAVLRDHVHLSSLQTGVAGKVVVIDAGSDHADGIAACRAIAQRVEGRLAALGTSVLLTGMTDARAGELPDDRERASFANRTGADLVVSIHVDVSASPAAQGIATFYYGDPRGAGASSAAGQALARAIQDELCSRTGALHCRSHPRTWDLLRMTRMPSVRVEVGYLSNAEDAARISDPAAQDSMAEAIASAITRFCQPRRS